VNDTLRSDEELATRAIAHDFNVAWKAGENPPDAYLLLPEHTVALDVTRLEEVDIIEPAVRTIRPQRYSQTN
jgi:hypothetical protein